MLETCGEVIALDLCEPKLSESFTDRVLAAREAQLARVKPRRRTRMFIYAGSSLAAAASIGLVFFMVSPLSHKNHKTVTAGTSEKIPAVAEQMINELGGGKKVTPQARADYAATDVMPLPDFTKALEKLLQKTQNTFENTRQGFKDLELLLYLAVPDTKTNEKIIEEYKSLNKAEMSGETSENQGATDRDPDGSSSPNFEPSAEPDIDNYFDAI
jgi:hypothetical protein